MSQTLEPRPSPPDAHKSQSFRSLEEMAGTEQFQNALHREFPVAASEWTDEFSRRNFLKLMGASVALAGLAGCVRMPEETIVPYVDPPAEVTPGVPLYFSTVHELRGIGRGVRVQQREGRPIKIEGNPQHPSSLGGTDVYMQASLLGLYDPERSQTPLHRQSPRPYGAFLEDFAATVNQLGGASKARIALLTETLTSPTTYAQIQALRKIYPNLRWYQYQPINRDNARAGAKLAFGRFVNATYDFSRASRILALDSNFLIDEPGSLRYARQFARNRRIEFQEGETDRIDPWAMRLPNGGAANVPTAESMARLYAVESTASVTGVRADHRLPVAAGRVQSVAAAIAQAIGLNVDAPGAAEAAADHSAFIAAVADDLKSHPGRSLVVVGDEQPPAVHALAHAINEHLGNFGATVFVTEPVEAEPVIELESLRELVGRMNGGEVDLLMVLGSNPVHTAPVDLGFAQAMERVPWRMHLGMHQDETAWLCHWHVPQSHYLESWSDLRGHDGTASIVQPLIAPLYRTVSLNELLAALAGDAQPSGYDAVRRHWRNWWQGKGAADFEQVWKQTLYDGVIAGTQLPVISDRPGRAWAPAPAPASGSGALEINFRADPTLFDGRYANNGWLQELPKPLTKLTWDNAALISPQLAVALKLASAAHPFEANGRLVELQLNARSLRLPVFVVPGMPVESVTVHLGHGRQRGGSVAKDHGFDAYALRAGDALWFGAGTLIDTGSSFALASTQNHFVLEGRDVAQSAPLAELLAVADRPSPTDAHSTIEVDGKTLHLSLYPEWEYPGYKWGMSIDLSSCIGCNACVVACVAENNTPVVGKEQVLAGREMHWLRIDTYFAPDEVSLAALSNPRTVFQPMLCQHCEKAPCELVCPVGATTHSSEGLNEMTYNRCIGTRYCSNNCPYKVRRFNFLQYTDYDSESLKLMRNPEVTVRSRGVMEKCTYCVQRIDHARIESKIAWVKLKESGQTPPARNVPLPDDGAPPADALPPIDVLPACAQACPAHAIVFGDFNDRDTLAYRMKRTAPYTHLDYGVLTELNTAPRTTYLRRLTNPNPALAAETAS